MEQYIVSARKYRPQNFESVIGQNSLTTTSDFTGFFQQAKTREEFMNLIKGNR